MKCLSCKHGDMFPSTTTYFCPADLCHQWCHKFVVLVGFVKLLHAVEPAAVEAFDAGIGLCDIRCHLVDDLITETGVGAQTGKVFPHIPIHLDQLSIDGFQGAGAGAVNDGKEFIKLSHILR